MQSFHYEATCFLDLLHRTVGLLHSFTQFYDLSLSQLPISSIGYWNMLGICTGCTITKTNIHDCVVGYYVPTCFRHFCKMLDMMFQHPGTVQCTFIYVWLYARFILLRNPHPHILLTKQHAYLF